MHMYACIDVSMFIVPLSKHDSTVQFMVGKNAIACSQGLQSRYQTRINTTLIYSWVMGLVWHNETRYTCCIETLYAPTQSLSLVPILYGTFVCIGVTYLA